MSKVLRNTILLVGTCTKFYVSPQKSNISSVEPSLSPTICEEPRGDHREAKIIYSLPSINVNPREWIKVNIYRGVNN